jgi:hypothetical protein
MNENSERRLASAFDEQMVRKLHPYREMTPEEFAARFSQEIACFSWHTYRFSDPELDAWITRLSQILFQEPGAPSIESLREQFLTPQEIEAVRAREQEEF